MSPSSPSSQLRRAYHHMPEPLGKGRAVLFAILIPSLLLAPFIPVFLYSFALSLLYLLVDFHVSTDPPIKFNGHEAPKEYEESDEYYRSFAPKASKTVLIFSILILLAVLALAFSL